MVPTKSLTCQVRGGGQKLGKPSRQHTHTHTLQQALVSKSGSHLGCRSYHIPSLRFVGYEEVPPVWRGRDSRNSTETSSLKPLVGFGRISSGRFEVEASSQRE
ncbi:hypothetical protein chiPu_0008890 [Chiloscyllium punctatum]|uniref:Uncharacterized protein n=1 Tax=Chiloscyllium punctatum TaxID=137246 RepID=A0A401SJ49_CHIPU|nr:hypothetical protein [Chiloscyllium punctatum]